MIGAPSLAAPSIVRPPTYYERVIAPLGDVVAHYSRTAGGKLEDLTRTEDATLSGSAAAHTDPIVRGGARALECPGGASDYAEVSTLSRFAYITSTCEFAVSFFAEWDDYDTNALQIPLGSSVTGAARGFSVFFDDRNGSGLFNRLRVFWTNGTTATVAESTNEDITAGLHHYLVSCDGAGGGTTMKAYIDGVEVASVNIAAVVAGNATNPMRFGNVGGSSFPFDGRISEITFFSADKRDHAVLLASGL